MTEEELALKLKVVEVEHYLILERKPGPFEFYLGCSCDAAWWSVIWKGRREYRPLNWLCKKCPHQSRMTEINAIQSARSRS
jgi:hypothetical protein